MGGREGFNFSASSSSKGASCRTVHPWPTCFLFPVHTYPRFCKDIEHPPATKHIVILNDIQDTAFKRLNSATPDRSGNDALYRRMWSSAFSCGPSAFHLLRCSRGGGLWWAATRGIGTVGGSQMSASRLLAAPLPISGYLRFLRSRTLIWWETSRTRGRGVDSRLALRLATRKRRATALAAGPSITRWILHFTSTASSQMHRVTSPPLVTDLVLSIRRVKISGQMKFWTSAFWGIRGLAIRCS